jgi:hypothetical protein
MNLGRTTPHAPFTRGNSIEGLEKVLTKTAKVFWRQNFWRESFRNGLFAVVFLFFLLTDYEVATVCLSVYYFFV